MSEAITKKETALIAGERLSVDLEAVRVFGWQRRVSDKILAVLANAIFQKATLPPVRVYAEESGVYLASSIHSSNEGSLSPDGGHHRTVAHYILGVPLPVEVLHGERSFQYSPIAVQDIAIVDDTGQLEAKQRRDPNYR